MVKFTLAHLQPHKTNQEQERDGLVTGVSTIVVLLLEARLALAQLLVKSLSLQALLTLLAVALATAPSGGMLLRGMVTLNHDPGAVGDVLYLSTTGGRATATAHSGNTDIVRIIGYCLDASNGQIWFNPDNTFVEVNA